MPSNIFLCGLSGSGKSTVAPILAHLRKCDAVDTDAMIVAAAGRTIAQIFAREGEAGFREREARAVAAACGVSNSTVYRWQRENSSTATKSAPARRSLSKRSAAVPPAPLPSEGYVGDITGPGITDTWGVTCTDLGVKPLRGLPRGHRRFVCGCRDSVYRPCRIKAKASVRAQLAQRSIAARRNTCAD